MGLTVAERFAAHRKQPAEPRDRPVEAPRRAQRDQLRKREGRSVTAARIAVVTAATCSRETGVRIGAPRDEEIDLDTNELFRGCKTWQDVKRVYEAFWNDLNPNSTEVVHVTAVRMPPATEPVREVTTSDAQREQLRRKPRFLTSKTG